MPSGGGAEQTLTTPSMANISVWDWSFDGKWILGGSDHQPGRHAICIFPIAAAPQAEKQMRMVTSHPDMNLYQARFSPDQKWISFIAAKAIEAGISTIFVVPASGGEWRRVTEAKYFDDKPRWSPMAVGSTSSPTGPDSSTSGALTSIRRAANPEESLSA